MNKDDLREVVGRLEALEALTKLFKNLWFDHIKGEIQDEKVKAYLMVFDDAFPGMDHVVEFVRKNAEALSSDSKVQDGFEILTQTLLNREIETDLDFEEEYDASLFEEESLEDEEIDEELTVAEREALETVGQGDIDALFVEDSTEDAQEARDEEVEAFLAADEGDEVNIEDEGVEVEEVEVEEETDLEDLLGDEEEEVEEETDLEDLLGDEEEEEEVEEETDLEDLLGDEEEEEEVEEEDDSLDIADLLDDEEDDEEEEDMSADISEEEMTALLGDTEDEEEEEEPAPKPKAQAKAKAKKKPAKAEEPELDDIGNGEESISQDEIDALFG